MHQTKADDIHDLCMCYTGTHNANNSSPVIGQQQTRWCCLSVKNRLFHEYVNPRI